MWHAWVTSDPTLRYRACNHRLGRHALRPRPMLYREQKALLTAAVPKVVKARAYRKYQWTRKSLKDPGGGPAGEIGAIARRVALRPLPIAVIVVLRLGQPRIESGAQEYHRVDRILHEQNKFILQLERAQFRFRLIVPRMYRLAFQPPPKL